MAGPPQKHRAAGSQWLHFSLNKSFKTGPKCGRIQRGGGHVFIQDGWAFSEQIAQADRTDWAAHQRRDRRNRARASAAAGTRAGPNSGASTGPAPSARLTDATPVGLTAGRKSRVSLQLVNPLLRR